MLRACGSDRSASVLVHVCLIVTVVHQCYVSAQQTPTQVNYTVIDGGSTDDQQTDNTDVYDWFKPIRVYTHELDLNHHLNSDDIELVRELVNQSAYKLTQIFSVFPISSTLRLAIDIDRNCGAANHITRHCMDSNRDDASPNLYDEKCGLSAGFNIPLEHLSELRRYTTSGTSPYTVQIPEGEGVNNTDLILYISSRSIEHCNLHTASVLAFAQICKRDQYGRPVASFLNICPDQIAQVSRLKLRDTIFHEMMHAVGFSSSSFKFALTSCYLESGEFKCNFLDPDAATHGFDIGSDVLSETFGAVPEYRFKLERTRTAWQQHIECDDINLEETLGPTLVSFPSKSPAGGYKPGDHWNWSAMMGSLMSQFVSEPYLQVLDRVTLSVLEDLGWYRVNYMLTDPLIWGSSSGCHFGEREFCEQVNSGQRNDTYMCQHVGQSGCHYLHLHKAVCNYTLSSREICRFYKIQQADGDQEGACFITNHERLGEQQQQRDGEPVEEFCEDCRCFVSSLTSQNDEVMLGRGVCHRRQCIDGELHISINNTWIRCPYNTSVTVEGLQGIVRCPPSGVLCTDRDLRLTELIHGQTTSSPLTSSVGTESIPQTSSQTTPDYVRNNITNSADCLHRCGPAAVTLLIVTLISLIP